MKRLSLLFLMVSLILIITNLSSLVYADDWQYTTQALDIESTITSQININPEKSNWELKDLEVELSIYPRARSYQKLNTNVISPDAEDHEDYLLFEWDEVEVEELPIQIYNEIRMNEFRPKIKEKISFPISSVPSQYQKYLEETENIESENYGIIKLASEIVEGEDDLFEVVTLVGEWIGENLEYELNEETENNVQSAKWVLDHRYGACDEFSNLFIALIRSLGIPARYIGGYAFTNMNGLDDFGSHAWAEVYFPGYGWVPFDVTYGQLGFVDVSHVNMGEKLCSSEGAIKTTGLGRDVQIGAEVPEADIEIIDYIGQVAEFVNLNGYLLKEEVDFGSYNLIYADIKNLKDYYIAFPIYISNNEKMELFSENEQQVILKPREEKRIFWKVKISEDLDRNYYYTLPVQIYTLQGAKEDLNIETKNGLTFLSEGDVDSIILDMQVEEDKTYSKEVNLNCNYENFAYSGDIVNVDCEISNTGNVFIKDLIVKGNGGAEELTDLGIGQSKLIELEIIADVSMKVSVKNNDISKIEILDIEVLDYPLVEIVEVSYPDSVKYEDVFDVMFSVNRAKGDNPRNVKINMEDRIEEFFIEELVGNQEVKIEISGGNLNEGDNKIIIDVSYEDLNRKEYQINKEIVIVLEKLTFIQKINVWFNQANRWLNGLVG